MPLPMVHLSIANSILDAGYEFWDLPQFYLGSISPDAIHMRENSNILDKNNTHLVPNGRKLSSIDESECVALVSDFINSHYDYNDMDFLWGYLLHILTDLYWTNSVYCKFVEDYRKDITPVQEERMAYYNDTDQLDQFLYNESIWRNAVWRELHNAKCSNFLDLLTAKEINAWNQRTLHWYDNGESQHKNPIKYITKENIGSFISSYSEKMINIMDIMSKKNNKICVDKKKKNYD